MSLVEVNPFPLADPPPDSRAADGPQQARREVNLLALAWRGRWLMLLFMIIGGAAAWAVLERTTPRYTSMSRIYVERGPQRILDEQLQVTQTTNYLYTQAELIRSSSVLQIAAEQPDNKNLESFRDIDNPIGFLKKYIQVAVGAKDDIISVMAEMPNGEDAAKLVNSVVEAYITKYVDTRKANAAEVLTILRTEKEHRDSERERWRTELDEFRRTHPELAVQVSDDNVVTLRFAALSTELNNTEIELLQAKALYNRVKKMYDTPTQRPSILEMAGAEQSVQRDLELERQVNQYEQALASERARWGEGHPRVKTIIDALTELKEDLKKKQAAIIDSYVDSIRQKYELLDHKRSELQGAYDKQFEAATRVSSLAVQLIALKDALARAERECDTVDDRIKEVDLTAEAGSLVVSVLEPAVASTKQSYPSRSRFLAIGIVLGALAGFALAWLRDILDHRLRSVDEIAEVLQLPVMGVLPHMGASQRYPDLGRIVAHAPRCSIAESVRTLRTALHFGLAGKDAKTIAITSPSPGDGKSTVASNLAIALAQADQRVLLIDADMRKPTQHIIFEITADKGLGSVLTERNPIFEAIVPSGIESLDLLPCGKAPSNPVELLNNGFFGEMLEELKQRYDKIIIDSPPVMPVADARVISAICDSTLLVLRAERTPRRLSISARNELWRVRAKRLGIVVNGAPTHKQGAYGYGYGYGYGAYGHYGGGDENVRLPSERRKKSRSLPAPVATSAVAADEI